MPTNKVLLLDGSTQFFNTIGNAINQANSGDTIRVLPGRYEENLTISKDLTIVGDGDPTITDNQNDSSTDDSITVSDNADLTVDGFNYDGAGTGEFLTTADSGYGDVTIKNTTIQNAGGSYVRLRDDPGDNFVFTNNFVTNNTASNGLRIRALDSEEPLNVDISGNVWEDNVAWALNVNNISGTISDNVVRNTDENIDPVFDGQWGMLLAPTDSDNVVTVKNNFIEGVDSGGVQVDFGASGTVNVEENRFVDNADGVRVGQRVEEDENGELFSDLVLNIENNEFDSDGGNAVAIEQDFSEITVADNDLSARGSDTSAVTFFGDARPGGVNYGGTGEITFDPMNGNLENDTFDFSNVSGISSSTEIIQDSISFFNDQATGSSGFFDDGNDENIVVQSDGTDGRIFVNDPTTDQGSKNDDLGEEDIQVDVAGVSDLQALEDAIFIG